MNDNDVAISVGSHALGFVQGSRERGDKIKGMCDKMTDREILIRSLKVQIKLVLFDKV
jgi:hypothetical protein